MTGSATPAPSPCSRIVKELLEGTHRIHTSRSPESRMDAAVDLLRLVTGGCRAMLVAQNGAGMLVSAKGHEDFEARAGHVFEHAWNLATKSHNEGLIVADSSARGMGYAVPVITDNRPCAAFYVASDSAARRLDSADLDAMRAAAEVIGSALNCAQSEPNAPRLDPLQELLTDTPPDGDGGHSLRVAKHAFEKRLLRSRLVACQGNIAAAARTLKMDRGQLSRLLKKHQVEKPGVRGEPSH